MVAIAMPRVRIPKVHTTVPANRVFLETEGKVAKVKNNINERKSLFLKTFN